MLYSSNRRHGRLRIERGANEQKTLVNSQQRASNDNAKKLLLLIADGYDRLAK